MGIFNRSSNTYEENKLYEKVVLVPYHRRVENLLLVFEEIQIIYIRRTANKLGGWQYPLPS